MKKLILLMLPVMAFALLSIFLYRGLANDPRQLDSQVVNQPMPAFALPDLMQPERTYTHKDLQGKVTLLNVWGVWCITCAVEMPYLTKLRNDQQVNIVGLYYDQDLDPEYGTTTLQQARQQVSQLLNKYGNPYAFNILDVYRDTALDLGVTGAPEHFLIDHRGVVRLHHVGDINPRVWQNKVGPAYRQLLAEAGAEAP